MLAVFFSITVFSEPIQNLAHELDVGSLKKTQILLGLRPVMHHSHKLLLLISSLDSRQVTHIHRVVLGEEPQVNIDHGMVISEQQAKLPGIKDEVHEVTYVTSLGR